MLLKVVSISYAARGQGKLKRRWPLAKTIVVAPEKTLRALKSLETLLLEQTNVKSVEYATVVPEYVGGENWVSSQQDEITVFSVGNATINCWAKASCVTWQGVFKRCVKKWDLCQQKRWSLFILLIWMLKAWGFWSRIWMEMAGLVRARKVYLHSSCSEVEAQWHESELDGKKIHINIH